MKQKKGNKKNMVWNMRASQNESAQIKRLAKRLNCSESAAVRRAVVYSLATMKI